jgi:myosin heavy subunit
MKDEIYTLVGPILVALNPFKWIKDLYTESKMNSFLHGHYSDLSSHPHVFGIARESYISLCEDGKDQSVLVSGESGSGKSFFVHL